MYLVVVPFTANKSNQKLVQYLQTQLSDFGLIHADSELKLTNDVITQPRVLDSGAISITSVMTAAGLAKRIYFNTFYDGRRYPLYTLTKKQDRYIRKLSYFGGGVELFHLGVIDGFVYYLDFTSLYPAMGYKHDLPYGAPEWWPSFDPPSPDEPMGFGKFADLTRRDVMESKDLVVLPMGVGPIQSSEGSQAVHSSSSLPTRPCMGA